MEEETISEKPIEKPKKNWPKIIAFSLLGLVLLSGAAYGGYWYAIQQLQPATGLSQTFQPTPLLTPALSEIQFVDMNELLGLECINPIVSGSGRDIEFIVNSDEQYKSIWKFESQNPRCKDFKLPSIDFSKKTLLGKHAIGTGCSIDFIRKVYRNDLNKKIIYSIKVVEKGGCDMAGVSMNWILLPKLPPDYNVEFEVK